MAGVSRIHHLILVFLWHFVEDFSSLGFLTIFTVLFNIQLVSLQPKVQLMKTQCWSCWCSCRRKGWWKSLGFWSPQEEYLGSRASSCHRQHYKCRLAFISKYQMLDMNNSCLCIALESFTSYTAADKRFKDIYELWARLAMNLLIFSTVWTFQTNWIYVSPGVSTSDLLYYARTEINYTSWQLL